jgi:hypothetical protein
MSWWCAHQRRGIVQYLNFGGYCTGAIQGCEIDMPDYVVFQIETV